MVVYQFRLVLHYLLLRKLLGCVWYVRMRNDNEYFVFISTLSKNDNNNKYKKRNKLSIIDIINALDSLINFVNSKNNLKFKKIG